MIKNGYWRKNKIFTYSEKYDAKGIRRETWRHTPATNWTLGKWKIQSKTKHHPKNSRCIKCKCNLLGSLLDDSPLYQVLKNVDYSDSPVSRNFINAQLTIQVHDWEQIDIELVKKFKQLNEIGKAIAIERIEELSEIPRYTQKESNVPDKEE